MKNSESTIGNFLWKFSERIAAQLISLIVSIILARQLSPSHYGIIAIVNIFIAIANVFVTDGFASALIQKKNADALDYSSVLYFSLVLAVVFYLLLFFTAPLISAFYNDEYESLVPVLRVLGISLIFAAISSVQQAYISKKMIFRKFFWATLFGTLSSAVVGIAMAYAGFGVWALVTQTLVNRLVGTIFLAVTLKKRPLLIFSFDRIKELLGFGSKILITNLLIQGYQELRAILIGKFYSSADLAYYDKGRSFPNLIVVNINASISAVLFPKIAKAQDDLEVVKARTRQSIRFGSYLMIPIMLGLLGVSENFVRVILTEKWLPCVPLLRLFCIIYLFQPIHTSNMQAIKGIGRSDITLKLEIVKKTLELILLIVVVRISVEAIAISMAILTTLFTFVNAYPNIKVIGYSFKEQITDLLPGFLYGIIMLVVVALVGYIPVVPMLQLVLQVIFGAATYVFLSAATKNKEFAFLCSYLSQKFAVIKKCSER